MRKYLCILIDMILGQEIPLYTYNDLSISMAARPIIKSLTSVDTKLQDDSWEDYFR